METIEIKTLIDITKPNVHRPGQGSELEQNQYKNWITLQQCLGLRSNIEFDYPPKVKKIDLKDQGFGSKYKGSHNVWTFTFRPDRTLAYANNSEDSIGLLYGDVHLVPIIKNLTETINISNAVFDLEHAQYKNTQIKALNRQS